MPAAGPARRTRQSPAAANDAHLLPVQRRQRIVEFLQRHGAVTLQQLEQALRVSLSTLRRDLDGLAADGLVDREHGGAVLRQQDYATFEPDHAAAAELSPHEKRALGEAAAAALLPGQSVVFDSGSTVLEAARAAARRGLPLTAVTNDLAIAQVLGACPAIHVTVLGGTLRAGSYTLIGDAVIEAARAIHADVLLLGAHAVSGGELSETAPEVVAVKRTFLRAARVRRLLIDGSKFRPPAFMRVADVRELTDVLTDDGAPGAEIAALRDAGVAVTVVPRA
ncbi:MAG: DeoR/GlpR family DNA-binding transcription regulator [Burkholderiales bacterium]